MRILNVHYTGFGGLASVVHNMATAKGAETHEWVMAYYGVAPLERTHADFCNQYGFSYEVFSPKLRAPWKAWYYLARWLEKIKPDAILCHSPTAIPPLAWYAKRRSVPLIAIEHTPVNLKSRSEWYGSRLAMLIADRVVVLTQTYADLLRARLGFYFSQSKVRTIPNGVSLSMFTPKSRSRSGDRLKVGMAARITSSKRHDLLLKVAARLDFEFEFVGDGELLAIIRGDIEKQGLTNVLCRGYLSPEQIPQWLRSLDVYVHASSGETFSMSILQAMAVGLPIVVSAIPGMSEIVGYRNHYGLLAENNVDSWLEALEKLADSECRRNELGKAARERVQELYSSDIMLARYLSVIHEVIQERISPS